jgi:hypothetical protein
LLPLEVNLPLLQAEALPVKIDELLGKADVPFQIFGSLRFVNRPF